MEFIVKFLGSQPSWNSIFQIGLDVAILALLAAVLVVKKPRISKKDQAVMKSFEKILEETGAISKEFESNLEKRQNLLQQITTKLDQRIQEAQDLCNRLEQLSRVNLEKLSDQKPSPVNPRNHHSDQQRVLMLAKKGLKASAIAKSLNRPVGEIELILNLQKIAS